MVWGTHSCSPSLHRVTEDLLLLFSVSLCLRGGYILTPCRSVFVADSPALTSAI
jgi:hypothetical protein